MNTAEPVRTVGMIGLGHMGNPVALRLLDRGFPVVVFTRNPGKAESLKSHGAAVAPSLCDLAGRVDVIISFLPDDRAVCEIYYGPGGVIANAARGLHILEMSTAASLTPTAISVTKVLEVLIVSRWCFPAALLFWRAPGGRRTGGRIRQRAFAAGPGL